ncbi:MAG: DUF1570 domain-containing protein [Pirellulales bacterium]
MACSSAALLLVLTSGTAAVEQVEFRRQGDSQATRLEGRVVVEAVDKSLLFQTADGGLYPIAAEQLIRRTSDARPFAPVAADEIGKQLLAGLPDGFDVHRTRNYVICYNSNKAYAQWVGALFERLHRAFHTFWQGKGIKLAEPEFPLCVLVFADEESYAAYAKQHYGEGASKLVAFYALTTNHVTLYDLTGVGALRREGNRRGNLAQVNEMLSHPSAAQNVATVVHEAFHQLQFNCGLSQRFADVPLWVAEGLAMYFETPDLKSAQGWRTIGAVNYGRLGDFQAYFPNRPAASLKSLVVDDARVRDPRTATAAYAEAWAINHFLMQRHTKEYVAYLKTIADKPPAVVDTPAERLKQFEAALGNFETLDAEFLRHVRSLR